MAANNWWVEKWRQSHFFASSVLAVTPLREHTDHDWASWPITLLPLTWRRFEEMIWPFAPWKFQMSPARLCFWLNSYRDSRLRKTGKTDTDLRRFLKGDFFLISTLHPRKSHSRKQLWRAYVKRLKKKAMKKKEMFKLFVYRELWRILKAGEVMNKLRNRILHISTVEGNYKFAFTICVMVIIKA